MTFTEIVNEIAEDLNLTSATAITRIGREVNRRYREIVTSLGLATSARAIATASTTIGDRSLTFTSVLKLLSVFDNHAQSVTTLTSVGTTATATKVAHGYATGSTVVIVGASPAAYNGNYVITVTSTSTFTYVFASGSSPATGTITVGLQATQLVLNELSFDEMRNNIISTQPPQNYAVSRMGANSVTIYLDCAPTTVFILSADVLESTTTLSGTNEPVFDENYHDILVHGGKVPELLKMEKADLSNGAEEDYQRRLADLRFFIAKSAYMDIFPGKRDRRGYRRNRIG